jgi:hypothetical protein
MTILRKAQTAIVSRAEREVTRLFPRALRGWAKLYPAVRLRKLDALRRLLAGELRKGKKKRKAAA